MDEYIKRETAIAKLTELEVTEPNATMADAKRVLADMPCAEAVSLHDIYRVIAGHSYYHGDRILAALTCIAEGKEVNPVLPTDLVPVVRCKDCKYYKISELHPPYKFCFRLRHPTENRSVGYNFADDDFCSHGECREGKDEK